MSALSSLQTRLRTANARRLDLSKHTSPALCRLLKASADCIGAQEEFVFYPLLTAVASCMGVNAHVNINPAWKEPAIMWFVVAAKKGEKKTAALRLIRQALEGVEKERIQEWEADISDDKPKTPPQLLVDNFSFEELHSVMKRNGNQTLGLFDEMSSFYAQLDLFKHTGMVIINLYSPRGLSIHVATTSTLPWHVIITHAWILAECCSCLQ